MDSIQMVAFRLEDNYFGIDIMKAKEIMGLAPITQLPLLASYMRGVIDVRGKVVPVVDTRMKLGLGSGEITDESRLLLVENKGKIVALLVDEVSEVITLTRDQIEPIAGIETGFGSIDGIEGIARLDNQLLIYLDTDKLL
jgi:purine-binding chemotaxis protein CheW